MTITQTKTAPPCAENPDNWDLDVGSPDTWRDAVETCGNCPLMGECARLARELSARGQSPRSMIWAGIGYDNSGRVIDNLDQHRVTVDLKRPTFIIHTPRPCAAGAGVRGANAVGAQSAAAAPRRQIVIHRGKR